MTVGEKVPWPWQTTAHLCKHWTGWPDRQMAHMRKWKHKAQENEDSKPEQNTHSLLSTLWGSKAQPGLSTPGIHEGLGWGLQRYITTVVHPLPSCPLRAGCALWPIRHSFRWNVLCSWLSRSIHEEWYPEGSQRITKDNKCSSSSTQCHVQAPIPVTIKKLTQDSLAYGFPVVTFSSACPPTRSCCLSAALGVCNKGFSCSMAFRDNDGQEQV